MTCFVHVLSDDSFTTRIIVALSKLTKWACDCGHVGGRKELDPVVTAQSVYSGGSDWNGIGTCQNCRPYITPCLECLTLQKLSQDMIQANSLEFNHYSLITALALNRFHHCI